eukprot:3504076-Rhodomonas_salina.1
MCNFATCAHMCTAQFCNDPGDSIGNKGVTPYFEIFMTAPGVSPVTTRGNTRYISASQMFGAGPGELQVVEISVDEYKDETLGDETWHKDYKATYGTKPSFLSFVDSSGTWERMWYTDATIFFRFSTHVVRRVHIRNKTLAEIWSEIGGLWAGATALMAFVFVSSGHLNTEGKVLSIFRYLPNSKRKEYLAGCAQNIEEGDHKQVLQDLMKRMGDLEGQLVIYQSEGPDKECPNLQPHSTG